MDAPQCYPANFQLRVLPQFSFRCEVPLPTVSNVVVVLNALLWTATGSPVKEVRPHGSRAQIQQAFAAGRDGFGGIVRFDPHQNSHGIAGEELPDASPQGKSTGAEDIPSHSETRSNQVIVAGCQRAVGANRSTGTCRTGVRGSTR